MPHKDREVRRAWDRAWQAQRREAYFADKTCARCDDTDRLQLHHVYKSTKVGHSIWSWSVVRRERELAKCVVLCHDCHQFEHLPERQRRARRLNVTLPRDERGRNKAAA